MESIIDKGVKGSKSTYPESSASPFKYTTKQPPAVQYLKSGVLEKVICTEEINKR